MANRVNDKYKKYNKRKLDEGAIKVQKKTDIYKKVGSGAKKAASDIVKKVTGSGGGTRKTYKNYAQYDTVTNKTGTKYGVNKSEKNTGKPALSQSDIRKGKENVKNVLQVQGSGKKYNSNNANRSFGSRALSTKQRDEQQWGMSSNAGGKFITNMYDSIIDNSPVGAIGALTTGKRLSDSYSKDNPYNEMRTQGLSAGAGRMAGMAIDYALARSALNPMLDKATDAVMNGTRVGEMIRGSSTLGRIGQSVGTPAAQNIGRGLVKETISDATLGFGQNALINYGEGLRNSDFWKQQILDTGLDFLVGGTMEGVGIGSQIRGVRRQTKNLLNESATSMLSPEISKRDYLKLLWERMNQRMRTSNNVDNAQGLRDAAYGGIDDLMAEYNKVLDMSDRQFARYRAGEPLDANKYVATRRSPSGNRTFEGRAKEKTVQTAEPNETQVAKATEEASEGTRTVVEEQTVRSDNQGKSSKSKKSKKKNKKKNNNKSNKTQEAKTESTPNTEGKSSQGETGLSDEYYYSFAPSENEVNASAKSVDNNATSTRREAPQVTESKKETPQATGSNTRQTNQQQASAKSKNDDLDYYKALYENYKNEGGVARQSTQRAQDYVEGQRKAAKEALGKRYESAKKDVNKLGDAATKEEKEQLLKYASEDKWDEFGEMHSKIKERKTKTQKKTEAETVAQAPSESQHHKVTTENAADETQKNSLKEKYPHSTTDEINNIVELRKAGDEDGVQSVFSKLAEREVKFDLKEKFPSATEEEIDSLFKHSVSNERDKFDDLAQTIRERSTEETKKSVKELNKKVSKRVQDAKTERQTLVDEAYKKWKRSKAKGKKKQALKDEYERLKNMDEGDYLVEKYNLNSGVDESTTKALATAYDKEAYIEYLDYRISEGGLNETRINKFKAEKRRVQAISDEQFENYQIGEFDPPAVAETTEAKRVVENYTRDTSMRDTIEKAEAANNLGKGRPLSKKKQKITTQEAFYHELLEKANKAQSEEKRAEWLAKANEIKNMPWREWKKFKRDDFIRKQHKYTGSKELSSEGRKALGIKGSWYPKKLSELKSYKGDLNTLNKAMAVIRELANDYTNNALLKEYTDSYHLKNNAPFTVEFLADVTGFESKYGRTTAIQKLKDIFKKAGVNDSRTLTVSQISQLTGVPQKTLNGNLYARRARKKKIYPDQFNPMTVQKITGLPADKVRKYVNASLDMHINEAGNIIINPSKEAKFRDGFIEQLKAERANTNLESEARKQIKEELQDVRKIIDEYQENGFGLTVDGLAEELELPRRDIELIVKYTPDFHIDADGNVRRIAENAGDYDNRLIEDYINYEQDFIDNLDTESILREVREQGQAPARTTNATPQNTVSNVAQTVGETSTERHPLEAYTKGELKKILDINNIEHPSNIRSPESISLLNANGIYDSDLVPSGKSTKVLPQGEPVKANNNTVQTRTAEQRTLPTAQQQAQNVAPQRVQETAPQRVQETTSQNASPQKGKGKPLSTKLQDALDGKLDYHELGRADVEKYGRRNGYKIPRGALKDDIIRIIERGLPEEHIKTVDETFEAIKAQAKKKSAATMDRYRTEGLPLEAFAKEMGVGNQEALDALIDAGILKNEADIPLKSDGTPDYAAIADNYKVKIPFTDEELGVTAKVDESLKKTKEELENESVPPKEEATSTTITTSQAVESKATETSAKSLPDKPIKEMNRQEVNDFAKANNIDIDNMSLQEARKKIESALDLREKLANASTSANSAGTATFTSTLSDSQKPVRELRRLERKPKQELPKGEKAKVEGAKQKPLNGKSTYKDVIARFKGKDEVDVMEEVEEAIKKFKGKDTSKTFETVLNSTEFSPEFKRQTIRMRESNEAYLKDVVTDKKVDAEAKRLLDNDFDGTLKAVEMKHTLGQELTKQDDAIIREAAKRLNDEGNVYKASELIGMNQSSVSESARRLAYQRWFYKATPEGRVFAAITSVKKTAQANGVDVDSIKLSDNLLEAIYKADSDEALEEAVKALQLEVWNQIPPKFMEKANAWRYLAMLGNPKTHIRNHLGNAVSVPARVISDSLSAGLEKALSKRIKDLGGDYGNHAILNRFSKDDIARLKLGRKSFEKYKNLISSESSKFMEMQRPIESPVFGGKIRNTLVKGNSNLLEGADKKWMGITYESAYAQYLKSHKIDASNLTEEIAEQAHKYAEMEALKATFRDPNILATAMNKFRRSLNPKTKDSGMVKVGKLAAGFAMDSTVPFVKTPLNILKRGALEYSPVGFGRGLVDIVNAKDAETLLKGIDLVSRGLTGTGVLAIGFYLGNKGIVNGSLGEWNKDVAYDKTLGKQDYAINIGDTSITLDWVAPMSMPFFVGVEAGTNTDTGDDVFTFIDALSNMTNPIFEMSMLQGIENTFNMAFSDGNGLSNIAKNAGFNYLSQYVPTLFGQISRTMADNRKTSLSTATNPLQKEMEKQFQKILNKTPIGNAVNQDYIDQWGRTDANDNKGMSFLENFLSPAYIAKKNMTPVDTEIKRLYDALGEEDKNKIIPTVNANAFKQEFDGKEYVMTPAEFTQYKKTVGQAKYKGLEELFKTERYKSASADEQRKMIESVYDEANKKGKIEYLSKVSKEYASAPDFYALDSSQREKYDETLDIGKEEWAKAYNAMTKAYRDVKANSGETLTTKEKAFALAKSGIKTLEQAQSFNKNISESAWENAQQAVKSGKTLEQMQKEAEARENMTEDEKKFDSYFRQRAEGRYDGKTVSSNVYAKFLEEVQYVDKHNPTKKKRNGSIDQSEAYTAINNMKGLTNAQKAYLWALAENDGGWKRKPFG